VITSKNINAFQPDFFGLLLTGYSYNFPLLLFSGRWHCYHYLYGRDDLEIFIDYLHFGCKVAGGDIVIYRLHFRSPPSGCAFSASMSTTTMGLSNFLSMPFEVCCPFVAQSSGFHLFFRL
jgi:hypothetical protein